MSEKRQAIDEWRSAGETTGVYVQGTQVVIRDGLGYPGEVYAVRGEVPRLLAAVTEAARTLGVLPPAPTPAANPRQGLRPCEVFNIVNGYVITIGFYHGTAGDCHVVEDSSGILEPVAVESTRNHRVRFTDIPATQEEAPEPKPEAPEITPGMRVRVAKDALSVDNLGNVAGTFGVRNVLASRIGVVQAAMGPISKSVVGVEDGDDAYYVRRSDLTPVAEEPEEPAFKFGDKVTSHGKQGLVINTPGSDGIVQVGEPSGDWFYCNISALTPGWPETATEEAGS